MVFIERVNNTQAIFSLVGSGRSENNSVFYWEERGNLSSVENSGG